MVANLEGENQATEEQCIQVLFFVIKNITARMELIEATQGTQGKGF